jgi:hypothetical protein
MALLGYGGLSLMMPPQIITQKVCFRIRVLGNIANYKIYNSTLPVQLNPIKY